MQKYMTRAVMLIAVAGLLVGLVAVLGCDGDTPTTGAVEGWAHVNAAGDVVITGTAASPPGFAPLADAWVVFEGCPEIRVRTNQNGRFLVRGLPAGTQTLVVEHDGREFPFQVTVMPGRTVSGDHVEGGGML